MTGNPDANTPVPDRTAIQRTGATFQINIVKLYIPVVTLSINDFNIAIFLITEQKQNMRSKMKILFKNLYTEQILVTIAFHTMGPTFGRKQ